MLGVALLGVLAILFINFHSKSEYFTPAMPLLFAAGSVEIVRILDRQGWRWLPAAYTPLLIATGILIVPMALDVLPPGGASQVSGDLRPGTGLGRGAPVERASPGVCRSIRLEGARGLCGGGLPRADAGRTAELYRAGGELWRGCVDRYPRKRLGLPGAISQHNSYYYWGFNEWRGQQVFIVIGRTADDLRGSFERVEAVCTTYARWAMPYENGRTIWVCKGLKGPFAPAWRSGKNFI